MEYSLDFFNEDEATDEIVLVLPEDALDDWGETLAARYTKIHRVVAGGCARSDSVRNGVNAVSMQVDTVAVHDGVRPFVSTALWTRLLEARRLGAVAVIPARPVPDTIKQVEGDLVKRTLARSALRAVQTPQVFDKTLLAVSLARQDAALATDEASLIEAEGHPVLVVNGDPNNRKITQPQDLVWMKNKVEEKELRIGTGFDVHRLEEGRKLILGGVDIPHSKGLVAHSDGDVLLHALMDALLGAMGLGDIGEHFPDSDERYRGISSMKLLAQVAQMMRERKAVLINADMVVIAQKPKILPWREQMRRNVADCLKTDLSRIGIKATTTEGLGFAGREEGIACQASCLVALMAD